MERLAALTWHPLLTRMTPSRHPTVLLYNGVPPTGSGETLDGAVLAEHLALLSREFELVPQAEVFRPRRPGTRGRVHLTFDDGLQNNAAVVAPLLRRFGAPATFFVSSRHARGGHYLWFAYLRALQRFYPEEELILQGRCLDMSTGRRRRTVAGLTRWLLGRRPHPQAMYDVIEKQLPHLSSFVPPSDRENLYCGMTARQVCKLADDPLFEVGLHTTDHPLLTRCSPDEIRRQISGNRRWIEEATGHPCRTIAYPSSNYDRQTLEICRQLGLERGFAVSPNLRCAPRFEVPRLGVYRASREILGIKAAHGSLLRALRLKVG